MDNEKPQRHWKGGRPVGAKNKKTILRETTEALQERLATKRLPAATIKVMSPLEVMIHAMQLAALEENWTKAAALAATAAPYVHPRLASETVSIHDGDRARSDESIQREIEELQRLEASATEARTVETKLPRGPDELVH